MNRKKIIVYFLICAFVLSIFPLEPLVATAAEDETVYTYEKTKKSSRKTTVVKPFRDTVASFDGVSAYFSEGSFDENMNVTIAKFKGYGALPFNEGTVLVSGVYEIYKNKSGEVKKPVKITVPFFQNKVDNSKKTLILCQWNEKEKIWEALDNLAVDFVENKISGTTYSFTKFAAFADGNNKDEYKNDKDGKDEDKDDENDKHEGQHKIKDIVGHWAEEDILKLYEKKLMDVYPDGTFRPDNKMTRAEFTSVLVDAFTLEPGEGKIFTDTQNHWAKEAIAVANGHGIAQGYSETFFGADNLLTREQMVAMVINTLELSTKESERVFIDQNDVSDWAVEAMDTAIANQIIVGYPDKSIQPQGETTRAEAAAVIVRAWEK